MYGDSNGEQEEIAERKGRDGGERERKGVKVCMKIVERRWRGC